MLTAAAGFLFASKHHLDVLLFLGLLLGLALSIGSACVFNNYLDRSIDKKMARTRSRAIPAGQVSKIEALAFASILGIVGLSLLAIFTNWMVFTAVLIAHFWYVVIYGLAKRGTVYSTIIGSVPGAAPPAAGYLAVTNNVNGAAILLFLALVFWQMPHFYAISMYRYKDYKAAGLPVMAVKNGMLMARYQTIAYIITFTSVSALLSVFGYAGFSYLVIIILLGVYWLYVAIKKWQLDDEKWGKRLFFTSLIVNLVWCIVTAFGSHLP